jgi:DNA polymerase-3 subunit epsilon
MMHLFFDTETTGFLNPRLPLNHPQQSRPIQFAGILTENLLPVRKIKFLIHPGDAPMASGALKVHGITLDTAKRSGIPPWFAIKIWHELLGLADEVVGHKVQFDLDMMNAVEEQANMPHREPKSIFCTLSAVQNIFKKPNHISKIPMKSATLENCIKYMFNETLSGAHDALIDTSACMRVYQEIKKAL